jgi:hypothetical protein
MLSAAEGLSTTIGTQSSVFGMIADRAPTEKGLAGGDATGKPSCRPLCAAYSSRLVEMPCVIA